MNSRRCRRVFGRDTEESIRINSADSCREHGIKVKLGCRVRSVNRACKSLAMQSGGEFRFEKLIAATGSRVRTLDIPGAHLASVQNLRSLDDSEERDVAPKWIESGQAVSAERLADVSHSVLETSPPRRDADNVRTQGEWRWRFRLRTVRPASGDL
jgi:NADH dehydrogenase FAD-containing subunit